MRQVAWTLFLAFAPWLAHAQGGQAAAPIAHGQPQIDAAPHDVDFGVRTRSAGLRRDVDMLQWVRAGDDYAREWRPARVDSSGFARGHENPVSIPLDSREWRARVTLEGKPLSEEVIDQLGQWRRFRPGFTALPVNMAATFQPEGDGLGSADNPLSPQVGDLRVTWSELLLPPLEGRVVLRDGLWTLAAPQAPLTADQVESTGTPTESVAMPKITLLFAALHALMLIALSAPIPLYRRRHRVGIGDGGNAELARRIRVQANFIEYVPLALLLLLLLELGGLPAAWLYAFGGVLLLARVLHAAGLSRSSGTSFGRFAGTVLTWLDLLAMAGVALWLALR